MSKKRTNKSSAGSVAMSSKKKSKISTPKSVSAPKKSALPFAPEDFGDLFDFLKSKGIAEFKWEKGDQKISVKTVVSSSVSYASAAVASSAPAVSAVMLPSDVEIKTPDSHKKVLSPFVGTFYRSPSPTSAPYVEVGKRVKPGDSLCIIEAMKLMNEIEADFAGSIVQVLAENGQPVEFGEPLFIIDTNG